MAWNKPGKCENSQSSQKPETPPDLDEVLRNLQQKFKKFFGRKPNPFAEKNMNTFGSSHNKKFSEKSFNLLPAIILFSGLVLLLVWFLSGFFIVEAAEKGVVLRFGRYSETVGPGLHWIAPLIESRYVVNVQQVSSYSYHAEMLTADENIVVVDLTVQYRIDDLNNYLFNTANPVEALQQATASALRQVVGQTNLDDILTSGREKIREQTQDILEKTLDRYHTGLIITDANLQPAKPPEEVTAAFDDAIKAREDEKRYINQAKAYANRIAAIAQGQVSRLNAEALAYQQQVVLNAKAATSRFLGILPQYLEAPEVTKERMYMDAIQAVMTNSSKVLIDAGKNSSHDSMWVLPLPLDKIMSSQKSGMNDNAEKTEVPLQNPPSVQAVDQDQQKSNDKMNNYPSRPQTYTDPNPTDKNVTLNEKGGD